MSDEPVHSGSGQSDEIEFAHCINCNWFKPVDEIERDRGYRGPCPYCGSPKTKSRWETPPAEGWYSEVMRERMEEYRNEDAAVDRRPA